MHATSDCKNDVCEPISEWPVLQTETICGTSRAKILSQKDCSVEISEFQSLTKKRETLSTYPVKTKRKCIGKLSSLSTVKEPLANTSIAKWWRSQGQHFINRDDLPDTDNANTLLSAIARHETGKRFIGQEVRRLSQLIQKDEMRADAHAALGSFLERSGHYDKAKVHLEKAVMLDPQDRDYRWLLHKVKRQLQILKLQTEGLQKLTCLESVTEMKPCKSVQRLSTCDLSFEDFFNKYELTRTPVIVTDIVSHMTDTLWTLQHVKQVAGHYMATVKTPVAESSEWARLEDFKTVNVGEFIDAIESSDDFDSYLFDWSLPVNCPELAQELAIPKYFAEDFLQRTSPGSLYKDSWPSLFIAPAGLISELHVDAFGSNFWMALFSGKKRWVFFPRKDVPFLYPRFEHSLDPVFDVDLSAPDLDKHPLLCLTEPVECVLQPGELLFVPAGCPHRVANLENSLAISANYVDMSNLDLVKQELSINGILDQRADSLYEELSSENFVKDMDFKVQNLKWKDFKNCNNGKFSCDTLLD